MACFLAFYECLCWFWCENLTFGLVLEGSLLDDDYFLLIIGESHFWTMSILLIGHLKKTSLNTHLFKNTLAVCLSTVERWIVKHGAPFSTMTSEVWNISLDEHSLPPSSFPLSYVYACMHYGDIRRRRLAGCYWTGNSSSEDGTRSWRCYAECHGRKFNLWGQQQVNKILHVFFRDLQTFLALLFSFSASASRSHLKFSQHRLTV